MALSTYANIARSIVDNRAGRIELPSMVTFIVTWRCNLRCFMCDVWKKTDHDDMTPEEAKAIFKQMPRLDTLRLTGGEPFLRRDLAEVIRLYFERTKFFTCSVPTNGFGPEEIARAEVHGS